MFKKYLSVICIVSYFLVFSLHAQQLTKSKIIKIEAQAFLYDVDGTSITDKSEVELDLSQLDSGTSIDFVATSIELLKEYGLDYMIFVSFDVAKLNNDTVVDGVHYSVPGYSYRVRSVNYNKTGRHLFGDNYMFIDGSVNVPGASYYYPHWTLRTGETIWLVVRLAPIFSRAN